MRARCARDCDDSPRSSPANTVFEADLPASPDGERTYQIALGNHNTGDADGRTHERGPSCG